MASPIYWYLDRGPCTCCSCEPHSCNQVENQQYMMELHVQWRYAWQLKSLSQTLNPSRLKMTMNYNRQCQQLQFFAPLGLELAAKIFVWINNDSTFFVDIVLVATDIDDGGIIATDDSVESHSTFLFLRLVSATSCHINVWTCHVTWLMSNNKQR